MWLLSTDRAELHFFARSFDADGGYAILSHTWSKKEQTFQEVKAIAERCSGDENPRDFVDAKIRECCILAEKHGYHWVWIDSCCIDKTSSSELSEAINSMYKWYQSSEVCYAYLKDVPDDDDIHAAESAFRKSKWHTRGWTLQELIAPDSVIFLSVDWIELGNRADLSELLFQITSIPRGVLVGEARPAECSASVRMFWASQRKTTRIKDEAYCLMGLFGVSMPTNYGEGKRAFIRLQYEIMQHQECDMSLFAFGSMVDLDDIISQGMMFHGGNEGIDCDNPWQYLLADSPHHFRNVFFYIPNLGPRAVQPYPDPQNPTTTGPFDRVELPSATAASYGVRCRLPVAIVDGITIAVILCENEQKRHTGLFLTKDLEAKDPQRPRYFTGCDYTISTMGSRSYLSRMCDLGGDLFKLTFNGKAVPQASWSTIYIVPTPSHLVFESAVSPSLRMNYHPASRFQLPRWLVDRFIGLQFEVDELTHGDTLQIVRFYHRDRNKGHISVCLGTCKEHGPDKPALWANAVLTLVYGKEIPHDCSKDHLDSESWDMRSRTFGDPEWTVRLSFTQSRRRLPETAFIIHLELLGDKFKEMLEESGTSFPSVADLKRDSPCPMPDALVTSSSPRHRRSLLVPSDVSDSSLSTLRPLLNDLEEGSRSVVPDQAPVAPPQPGPSSSQVEDFRRPF